MSRIKLADIQEELAQCGWRVLSEKYENLDTEMRFICAEGHEINTTWKKLRNHIECPICNKNEYKVSNDKIIPKSKGTKRVLGLDQATKITGFSIFEDGKLIKYGTVKLDGFNTIDRDASLRNWLVNTIKNWQIDFVGMEGIQMQTNLEGGARVGVTTFEALARLQGILMITLYDLKVPFEICHTAVWRQHCGVKGKTRTDKKRSMKLLAKEWYDVSVTEDEADAIGIGKYSTTIAFKHDQMEDWE